LIETEAAKSTIKQNKAVHHETFYKGYIEFGQENNCRIWLNRIQKYAVSIDIKQSDEDY